MGSSGLGWVALCAATAAACGGTPATAPTDAGADALVVPAYDGAVSAITPPAAVDLPRMTPCPAEWREVPDAELPEIVTCDPWPEGGPPACPAGEAWFPGDSGCTPIGAICPKGPFAEGLPGTGVIYVAPGATDGDGTRDRPFGRIADAAAMATSGTTIALARGTFRESVSLGHGVALVGACPAETILSPPSGGPARAVIDVAGIDVVVRDVQLGPSEVFAISASGAGRSARVDGLIAIGNRVGVFAHAGGVITGGRWVIRGTSATATPLGGFGWALDGEGRGVIEVDGLIAEANEFGVLAFGRGTRVVVRRGVVRDTIGSPTADGFACNAQEGASLELVESVVERATGGAVVAGGLSTALTLDTMLVRDTFESPTVGVGYGVVASGGGRVSGTRVAVDRSVSIGVIAREASSIELADVVVRDTETETASTFGIGIQGQMGSTVALTRVASVRSGLTGVVAFGPGTVVTLGHALIADTRAHVDGSGGGGVAAGAGATLELRAGRIERTRTAGAYCVDARLVLQDTVISDTSGSALDGTGGNAVVAHGAVELRRVVARGAREVGVLIGAEGSGVLEDVSILMTQDRDCAATSCRDNGAGMGLGVYSGGRATVTRFEIRDFPLCGVHVAGGGEADLCDGLIRGGDVGVCLADPVYAIARVTCRTRFEDVDVAVAARELPIPEPMP